ncbi:P-loop containing nucleoside triphosphate hydrolase protein [Mycena maculata]|uniref:P-loop containing nucleoside triphosphate hydrolase protein n=1 Tax=Mycena maculata TaxID=230809 RepID=A0AAD7NIH8_9AGAR|nr:P-loop containing nucleoside triphosphate hydrolase protein [Mycena maculata]
MPVRPDSTFTIVQNIFKSPHPPISVTAFPCAALTPEVLQDFLDTASDGIIGVAPAYGAECVLSMLAFSSAAKVILVPVTKNVSKNLLLPSATRRGNSNGSSSTQGGDLLEDLVLCADSHCKVAFQMDVLATALYHDFKFRISGGVDLLSFASDDRRSLMAMMNSLGGEPTLNKANVIALFQAEEKLDETPRDVIALQAWVAWRAATLHDNPARFTPQIDTTSRVLTDACLTVYAKLVRDACRLSALKPTEVNNEIADEYTYHEGQLQVLSTRFKNRLRLSDQRIEVEGVVEGRQITVSGQATRVDGRAARINVKGALPRGPLKVTTVGRERPTSAEQQRVDIILKALQGTSTIADQPFFQAIWLPREIPAWPVWYIRTPPIRFSRPLNNSQERAVAAILSAHPINVIQGPPGTGKTTVIAAAVTSIGSSPVSDRTIWLCAQSNVAVKNIAEKLAAVGPTSPASRTALTSGIAEFHYDWHEHLYEKINPNLVRSDLFTNDIVATGQLLMGSKVILCTLSMLSSFRISAITRLVPLQTVIVDEASQVEIGDFLPLISRFSHTLRKLVFIGDDKQLAPYGQNDVQTLRSVFEMEHLRRSALFLDTQYRLVGVVNLKAMLIPARMPTQLGKFIGQHVYDNKLKTIHPDATQCCHFINVKKGREIQKGLSWVNIAEVSAAVAEARKLDARGLSYRIITPYDAQRGMLETALKAAKIPWEDKVFCVDSFQVLMVIPGNEDDYIIVSLVRTDRIGFLAEKRRVNVLLTRCRKSITLCTSRAFVEGIAKKSLVGLLASGFGPAAWER